MIKSKKQSLIVIGVFTLVMLLGTVTYAFFNYTRTGSQNIIKTGRIYFNSEQGTVINLTNLFPVDPTETGVMDDATKVGTVTINVVGDTTYSGGIEYLVSAVNVQNSVGSKQLPISIQVSVEDNNENDPSTSLGTLDADYFTNRGTNAQTSIYKVLATDVIKNNDQLVVGYIKSGQDGVDGNIVIKAYIDKEKVAISDTYTEGDRYEVISGLSSETLSECVTHLESINYNNYLLTGETLNDFCAGTGTIDGKTFQETLDRGAFDSTSLTYFIDHNIIRYLGQDGTTDEWVDERDVFTTGEWNSLQTNGVSFQVKVEANEGVWVEELGRIESCPGCKFMYTTNTYYYGGTNNPNATLVSTLTGVTNDYRTLNKNYFLGFTESNGKIARAFACGINDYDASNEIPFCIEGATDESTYSANKDVLDKMMWAYRCGESLEYGPEYMCTGNALDAGDYEDHVGVWTPNGMCIVKNDGRLYCSE